MQQVDGDGLQLVEKDGAVLLQVRVAPRASRERVLGTHDGALKVGLTAPPVDGAANAALLKLLSKTLGVPRGDVSITAGAQSRNKALRVEGTTAAEVRARLELP